MNPQMFSAPNLPQRSYNVIFPRDKITNRFHRGVYTESMTEGKISYQEINNFLDDVELVTTKLPLPFTKFLTFAHRFALPLIVLLFLTKELNFTRSDKTWQPFIWYCFVALVYTLICTRLQFNQSREKIDAVVQIYQAKFNKKGFRLFVPLKLQWIELQKDIYSEIILPQTQPNLNQNIYPNLQAPVIQNQEQGNILQSLITQGYNFINNINNSISQNYRQNYSSLPNPQGYPTYANNYSSLPNPQIYPIYMNNQGFHVPPQYQPQYFQCCPNHQNNQPVMERNQ